MKKFGILRIEAETSNNSFKVILEVNNKRILNGKLTDNIGLLRLYKEWYKEYLILGKIRSTKPRYTDDGDDGYEPDEDEKTNISSHIDEAEQQDICARASKSLQKEMRYWLDSLSREIREELIRDIGDISNEYALIIQVSQKNIYKQICQLPWHVWDLLDTYINLEVSLSTGTESSPVQDRAKIKKIQSKVEMLAITGGDSGINPLEDINLLTRRTKDSLNLTPLLQPDKCTLADQIKSDIGWNILFFAGHSSTNGDGGVLEINKEERVNIIDLRKELETAVENGLRLAIFNSCDGLGLAQGTLNAGVPFAIVMRDSIPDRIAQYFLREFIEEYIQEGRSLHTAVRLTRKKLHQEYEATYPGISSLPVIVQHLNAPPPVWHELRGIESPYKGLEPFNESDRSFLFGREQALEALKALVDDNPVTFIIGEAGSGKTSLVQAGLIPTLKPKKYWTIIVRLIIHTLNLDKDWEIIIGLICTFKKKKDWIIIKNTIIVDYSLDGLYNLNTEIQKYPNQPILIIIDKFERLFYSGMEKQKKILERLAKTKNYLDVKILVISKYLPLSEDGTFENYPCIDISKYDLDIIEKSSINNIIKKPASLFDIDFEGELSDTIANDINDITNNLPFLQLLLKELWKCTRKDNLITYQAYRNLGGADGVISKYARDYYDSTFTDEEKEYVQLILIKLVQIDEFDLYTCKPTNKQELIVGNIPLEKLNELINRLENSRLLKVTFKNKDTFLQISRRTLVSEWIGKQHWFKDRQELIRNIQWTEGKYHEWESKHKSKKVRDLLRGKDLDRAKKIKKNHGGLLSKNAIDLIDNSVEQDALEKTKSKVGWSALSLLAISIPLLCTVVIIPLFNTNAVSNLLKDSENSLRFDTTHSLLLAISAFTRDDSFKSQIALWKSFNENHERSQINDSNYSSTNPDFSVSETGNIITINNNKATLRNINNASDIIELSGHRDNINYATFDPNNSNRLITSSADNTALIWDITNKKLVTKHKLTATQSINHAAFSPDDSNKILTVGGNGDAILWNTKDSDKPTYLKGHRGDVRMGTFSAKNSKQLLTVSQDSTAKVWNSDRPNAAIYSLPHNLPVRYGEFSPHDANTILTRTQQEIYIWHVDKSTVPIVLKGHSSEIIQTIFNPSDPNQIISVGKDGECFRWNLSTRQPMLISKKIRGVSFYPSHDGLLLLSVGLDRIARLWNIKSIIPQELEQYSLKHNGSLQNIVFNPKNPSQILTRSDSIIRVWDISPNEKVRLSLNKYLNNRLTPAVSAAFSSRQKDRDLISQVLTINRDSTLNIWNIRKSSQNNTPISTIPIDIGTIEKAWFNETKTDWIAMLNQKGSLYLWNYITRERFALPQSLGEVVQYVHFDSNNPNRVLVISDRKIGIWNTQEKTISLAPTFRTKSYTVINAEFLPNNHNSISILDSNGKMHYWNVGTNEISDPSVISLPATVDTFKFIPSNSTNIIVFYKNGSIENKDVSNLNRGSTILANQQEQVLSTSLSDNIPGQILTGTDTGKLKLWDIASPEKQLVIEVGKNKRINLAQISPNNLNQALALDSDGKVSIYDIGGKVLLKASLNSVSRCFSDSELGVHNINRQDFHKNLTKYTTIIDRDYFGKPNCQN